MSKWTMHRKDRTHDSLAARFRLRGKLVFEIHNLGGGAPDLIVCPPGAFLVDCKTPGSSWIKRKKQKDEWQGQRIHCVMSEAGADALLQKLEREKDERDK